MEGLTRNIVHKAQKSALRWFSKPKHIPGQFEEGSKQDETSARAEVTTIKSAAGPVAGDQQVQLHEEKDERIANDFAGTPEPTSPLAEEDLGRPSSAVEHDLEELSDQPPAQENGRTCDTLAYGEDVMIGGLDEGEYTTMGGIVNGFDGVKNCPVLLLHYKLATRIQTMIEFQREVLREERQAQAKLKSVVQFEEVLEGQILNHKRHIAAAKDPSLMGQSADTEEEPNRLANMQVELENLEHLLEGTDVDKRIIESNASRLRERLQGYQADVNFYLEQAFVDAEAIQEAVEEEDEPVPEISLQEEYEKLAAQMRDLYGTPVAKPNLTTLEDVIPGDAAGPPDTPKQTPEEEAQLEASKNLWEARENLQYARVQFNEKERRRQRELNETIEAAQRGEPTFDDSPEAFDIRWAIRFREITREVIDAERELSRARLAAKEAGLKLEDDNQSSCFPDDEDDGKFELMSSDIDSPEVFAGDERMIAWMKSLADSVDPDFSDPADVDEWGSGEEVDISDSASAVAQGSERKRLDKWEELRPRRASIA